MDKDKDNANPRKPRSFRKGCNIDEHCVPLQDLLKAYGTNPSEGLNSDQVNKNRELFGSNVLEQRKKRSEVVKFLVNTVGGINALLWLCAAASLAVFLVNLLSYGELNLESLSSGISLTVVVLIASCFSYYQEYQSNKVLESFKTLLPQTVNVIRNGNQISVDASELVVGDVIEISYGDKVSADLRILESESLKVDNSSLTGESEPQCRSSEYTHKDPLETENLLFFSTIVCEGRGKGLVIRVGNETVMGRLCAMASTVKSEKTPLARETTRIIKVLSGISIIFGLLLFTSAHFLNYSWMESLFLATGIVLANVPENLQVTLTIILALGAKKLAEHNCIVKNLHAVETLGAASVICSDKTGTITQNKMSVSHLWLNDKISKSGTPTREKNDGFSELALAASLCGTAKFATGQKDIPIEERIANGDPSEVAILQFLEANFGNVEDCRKENPKLFEIPFNSANKYQASVHLRKDETNLHHFVAVKGAPEKIIGMCKSILIGQTEYEMTTEWAEEICAVYTHLGGLGERVLGFCDSMEPTEKLTEFNPSQILNLRFRFLGLISLIDPPRASVPDAVMKCRSAGIQVVMVTGDHPTTATAIARSVGIISQSDEEAGTEIIITPKNSLKLNYSSRIKSAIITGDMLQDLCDEKLDEILSHFKEIVFARTSPDQKYRIVDAFQRLGHVVAVTGDGINDSPALKKANIGIAMGSGSDVSKEVADLILLDDNFTSIVTAIEHGRLMFDNLKKLMRYLMADNVAEMYCYLMFMILRTTPPMGTLAMLVSTLCEDVFPAISLARESAESDIMKLKPRDPEKDTLMSVQMLSYSYGQVSIIETVAGFFAYFITFWMNGWAPNRIIMGQGKFDSKAIADLEDSYGQEWGFHQRAHLERQAQTAFFLGIVLTQFANAIACKTRRLSIFQKGMKNRLMNQNLILMLLVACFVIYVPGVNTALGFVPLRYESWLAVLPFSLLLFFYDELRRLLVRTGKGNWISRELQT